MRLKVLGKGLAAQAINGLVETGIDRAIQKIVTDCKIVPLFGMLKI
jgi:hypothetical protein